MGKEKTTERTTTEQTTTPEPTAEERELTRLQMEQAQAFQPGQIQTGLSGLELLQRFLTGGELPGYFAGLPGGMAQPFEQVQGGQIPLEAGRLGEEHTSQLVQKSLADIMPQFQASGIMDSGVAAEISGRTAGDIRRQVGESNIERELGIRQANIASQMGAQQFNIGTEQSRQGFNMGQLLNLLNIATGAPAQIQQPQLAQQAMLQQSLAGQRGYTTTGYGETVTQGMNPFFKSFQQSLGSSLGSGQFGAWKFGGTS